MKRTITIAAPIALLALIALWWFSNPLHGSDAAIQAWLFRQTPVGTPYSDVQHTAQTRGWFNPRSQGSDGHTSGTYIRGELGCYRIVFVTCVTVFWEFDSSNKLSAVRVWKTTDAL